MLDIGFRGGYGWRIDYGLKLTNDRTALAKRGYREVFNEEEGVGRKTRFLRNEAKSIYVNSDWMYRVIRSLCRLQKNDKWLRFLAERVYSPRRHEGHEDSYVPSREIGAPPWKRGAGCRPP